MLSPALRRFMSYLRPQAHLVTLTVAAALVSLGASTAIPLVIRAVIDGPITQRRPGLLVPLAGLIALAGGLSIALGFHAKAGAWLLVLFLVPVTLTMHRFWAEKDPMLIQMQQVNFLKNLALLGGVLLIGQFGAGPMSVDARRGPSPAP